MLLDQYRRNEQHDRDDNLDELLPQTVLVLVMMVFMVMVMTVVMTPAMVVSVFSFFVMMMFAIFHNATFFPLIHRILIAVIFGGKSGKFFVQPSCIIVDYRFSLATA